MRPIKAHQIGNVGLNIAPPARPRVLLADDHIAFLESVSRLLAAAFDIVALAGDGRQALDLARRLRPDVVVLDVTELTHGLPFFTVCSYPIDCFDHSEARNHLPNLCAEHSAVTSGTPRGGRVTTTEVAI